MLGLSTVGSIALGEIAFQSQKKRQLSEGHIELMRHYGFLGPAVALLAVSSTKTESPNLGGVAILAGGIAGLIIGNSVAKKSTFTRGDVDAISSLTWISAGLGFAVMVESFKTNSSSGLLLIPAATAIAGTILGQQSLRGVQLTQEHGSAINLASGGAALIGLGAVLIAKSESPAVIIGVPSGLHSLLIRLCCIHSR